MAQVSLKGQITQGGFVVASADKNIATALLDNVSLPIHQNKRQFVFGFSREQQQSMSLVVNYADGSQWQKSLSVKQRQYDIDRINGVAQKYVSPAKEVLSRIRSEAAKVKQARSQLSYRNDYNQNPIMPAKGRISGVYGSQRIFNDVPKRPHFGLDVAGPIGTPVVAPWSGKVVLAEPDLYYSGGTLVIDHGMGVTTTYIHLSKLDVNVGDVITQGQKIAEIGATGRVTGPHLDWRLNWFDKRLDPQLLF